MMNHGRTRVAVSATAALALALVVAGCTPTDSESTAQEQSDEAGATTTPAPADEDEPTGDSPDPEPESTTETEAPAGDGADCVVGQWTIPQAQMQEFYDGVSDQAGFTIDGDVALTFTESTFEYLPDFTMEIAMAGQQATGEVGGSVTGSYTSDDGVITTSNEDNSLAVSMNVGGQEIDGGTIADSFLDQSPVNSAPYECSADELVLMFQGADAEERIPMHLEPAG